jgi:hypothetical protein
VEITRGDDGGIIHDRVESAEGRDGEGDETFGAALADEILDMEDGIFRSEFRDDGLAEVTLETVNDNAGAFFDTLHGNGLTDAGATAGDEDDFVF